MQHDCGFLCRRPHLMYVAVVTAGYWPRPGHRRVMSLWSGRRGGVESDACFGFELSQMACLSNSFPVSPSPVASLTDRQLGPMFQLFSSRCKSSCLVALRLRLTLPSHSMFSSALYAMTAYVSTSFMRIHISRVYPRYSSPYPPVALGFFGVARHP